MMTNTTPKIYVACLAAYNSGYLHGRWIDANQSKEEIYENIKDILKSSPVFGSEEWAIHDYEGFGSLRIHEYAGVSSVCESAGFIEQYGELGTLVADYYGNLDDARVAMDNYYHGAWDSELDFASELFDEAYEIPEHLLFYIDYEKFSQDIFINDYFSIRHEHKVHVFSYHL